MDLCVFVVLLTFLVHHKSKNAHSLVFLSSLCDLGVSVNVCGGMNRTRAGNDCKWQILSCINVSREH